MSALEALAAPAAKLIEELIDHIGKQRKRDQEAIARRARDAGLVDADIDSGFRKEVKAVKGAKRK